MVLRLRHDLYHDSGFFIFSRDTPFFPFLRRKNLFEGSFLYEGSTTESV